MPRRIAAHGGTLLALFQERPSRVIAARQALFREGTPASELYFLVRGRIRLMRHTESGHAVTLHVGEAGNLFAEGVLFSDVYQCDAVADQTSEVKAVGKSEMVHHLGKTPALALELLERVTRQLHQARALVELRAIRSAEQRVLHHLLLSLPVGARQVEFRRPLMQVATDLGLTHEVYYRSLAKLARNGLIKREGRRIRLLLDRPLSGMD